MDRLAKDRKKYKLYTHYGNNSGVPARTKCDWDTRRKIKSLESCSGDEQPMTSSSAEVPPSIMCSVAHLAETFFNEEMPEDESTSDDGSMHSEIDNAVSSENTEESEDDLGDETNDAGAVSLHVSSSATLSGYSTEQLIPTLLTLAIKLRHSFSYSATEDVLLLAKIMTDVRITHNSKYDCKKIANSLCNFMSIHHFCDTCHSYVGKEVGVHENTGNNLICLHCNQVIDITHNWRSGNVILYLNLKDQIQYFLELHHGKLITPLSREKKNFYALEDIFDGRMYRKMVTGDTITINFNYDGTPVFKSSPSSAYPILCTINEIPPKDRGKNMILCSLWFGEGKPKDTNELLKPFVSELQSLYTQGLDYIHQGEKYHKKCQVLVGICDSVARPLVSNSIQFNGEYGCSLCLHPGVQVPKGKGSVRVYPIDDSGNPFGEGLRSHEETLIHATNAEKGMKRRSIMYDVPCFDVVNGLPADWMHLVALGVAKQFSKLWLDSQYKSEQFYLGNQESSINTLLASFTPTMEISRTTREISDRKYWKAHEWSIWLLFYSLPILKEIASRKYVEHWACLVDGISILLKTSIMRSEIEYARHCLYEFVKGVKELYGIEHVSFNVHLLTHLPDSVLNWGPLWTHSAFIYESFNHHLKNCVHSSNGVPLQICDSFRYQIAVLKLRNLCEESLSRAQRNFLSKMLHSKIRVMISQRIDDIGILGKVQRIGNLSRPYYLALRRLNIHAENYLTIDLANRILINDEIIHSKQYRKPQKRKNYIILSKDQQIFQIEQFIILSRLTSQKCYAIGHYFHKISSPFSRDRQLTHLIFVKDQDHDLAAIDVQSIVEKVTLIHLPKQAISVACAHPNKYESWR